MNLASCFLQTPKGSYIKKNLWTLDIFCWETQHHPTLLVLDGASTANITLHLHLAVGQFAAVVLEDCVAHKKPAKEPKELSKAQQIHTRPHTDAHRFRIHLSTLSQTKSNALPRLCAEDMILGPVDAVNALGWLSFKTNGLLQIQFKDF